MGQIVVMGLFGIGFILLILFIGMLYNIRRTSRSQMLALVVLTCLTWCSAIAVFLTDGIDINIRAFMPRIYYTASALLPLFMIFFANTYSKKPVRILSKILMTLICMAVCAMVWLPVGTLFNSIDAASSTVTLNSIPYLIYTMYFMLYFIISVVIFFRNSSDESLHKKYARTNRRILIFWGISGVAGSFPNLWLPWFDNYSLIALGPLCVLILIPILSVAAITDDYFSVVKIVIKGLASCAIASLVLAGGWAALTFITSVIDPGYEITWKQYAIALASLIIVLGWIFILQRLGKAIIRRIDSDGYDEARVLRLASEISIQSHGIKDFFSAIRHTLDKAFNVERVDIIIFNQDTSKYFTNDSGLESALNRTIVNKKYETVYVEEIRNRDDHTAMKAYDIETITPIIGTITGENGKKGGKVIGAILMSPRKRRFSRTYGETLEKVSAILSPFIQAAVFYEQIAGFNTKLKHEVQTKTQKLRESNRELKRLDGVKDDLLTIASHQLRTPLTGVIGYTDMLRDGDFGKLKPEQEVVLDEIIKSSKHMNQMLIDYLDAARIDTGRFVLRRNKINLSKTLDEEIGRIKKMANEYNRELKYSRDDEDIEVFGDTTRLRQVILNLIDNAIYYGNKKIEVDLHRIGKMIVFTVKDDGIGVPKAEQDKLFTKMFRASNAKNKRPDGSGIGLYVMKTIIEDSGGEVIFESTENKGSVFGFKIAKNDKK